ncbi:universal stress protein [Desulfoprunum benzoelyticum]|uniref:Nucleotide-binding universal stress UspA family protein n=1 Tax=Desulfoprunum benzoelyticum TaxID=1506996 RepID=A0A840UP53_9BACT|nr:universal stress protein [Desulfoprunum benzoelyticum]MBB5348037.1 nucleotide-binding universal stress UspA family protein [Desulfoprunum benzoelyticum]MBM9531423.1 universal stress protein [Desulfoprunum benzoelyticum]
MLKILIPIDGSAHAQRAVNQVLDLAASGAVLEIFLLNVQIPIASGHARMFVSKDDVDAYHREEGLAALADARARFEGAGLPCSHHIAVGRVAETIVRFARERGVDKIVMGTHGRGGLAEVLMGSVAREVLRDSPVPVLLVK